MLYYEKQRRLVIPNWVKNKIVFDSENDLKEALVQLGHFKESNDYYEERNFSFTWVVPYPETKEECIEKYGIECVTEDPEKDHIGVDDEKPWLNWYVFNNKFWGCKWDASEVHFDGQGTLYFDTPWSPPESLILALAEKLPDIPFYFGYAEEQGNLYCGEFFHYKEDAPEDDFWNELEQCSAESSQMYNDLWSETYYECEEDGCYHADWENKTFMDCYYNLHYFDYADFSKENKQLAKALHEKYKEDFDKFIVEELFGPYSSKENKQLAEDFLKETIGFYKPCWEDEKIDPNLWEVDHVYNYVSSFEEDYAESF